MGGETRRRLYLDSSVALHVITASSRALSDWFDARVAANDRFVSSALLELEMIRVFRREDLDTSPVEDFVGGLDVLAVDGALLREAVAILPHVKTLDAIHLATAQRVGAGNIAVVSHDANMLRVAEQLGFDTFDPVADSDHSPHHRTWR